MKKISAFFSVLLLPLDYCLLVLAGFSAYYFRFSSLITAHWPVSFDLPFPTYFRSLLFIALVWIVLFFLVGVYQFYNSRRLVQELEKIIIGSLTGFAAVAIIIFFRRAFFDSRFIVLLSLVLAIIYVSLGHALIRWLERKLYYFGWGLKKVVLVGNSKTTDNLIAEFSRNRAFGLTVVKRLRDFSLETAQEFAEFLKENEVDEVIQSDPNLSKAEILRLYDFTNEYHLTFKYVADLLEVKVLRTEVREIIGMPIVEVKRTTLEGWGRVLKRIFDIIISGIFILILSPIFILTALAILLDSRGPLFFSRRDDGSFVTRIGAGGRPFKYFKFRSMIPNSDSMRYHELADRNLRADGPMVKIKDDPRVTRVGKFIRRWSLDELPELILVFIGRMSLVGPRPHLPEEVAKYENYHKKTLTIKPGVTGLAQVSGRSDLLFEEEVKLDIYYIENWSLMLDIAILLKTPMAIFKHRQAE